MKILIFLIFGLIIKSNIMYAQSATCPYSTGFEENEVFSIFPSIDDIFWEDATSTNFSNFFIDNYNAHSGVNYLVLASKYVTGGEVIGGSITGVKLKLNISDMNSCNLSFFSKVNYSASSGCSILTDVTGDHTESGLFLVNESNGTSLKILDFKVSDTTWVNSSMDIAKIAIENSIPLDNLSVKFQFYAFHDNINEPSCAIFSRLCIDDINLTGVKRSLSFTNTDQYPLQDGDYLASDYIEAGSNVTIQNNATVSFTAGNYIKLKSGFTAESGSLFTAKIGSNTSNLRLASALNQKQENISDSSEGSMMCKIFPNPTKGDLNIHCSDELLNATIFIVNSMGQIVYSSKIADLESYIDISIFKKGLYFVKILDSNGTKVQKIILE